VLILSVLPLGRSGFDGVVEFVQAAPGTQVRILAQHEDPFRVQVTFSARARGYLLIEETDSELMHAIRKIANGNPHLHRVPTTPLAVEADSLSGREHEVLHLLALGHTNKEIARLLFMSVRTAETHRGRIMQKLGLRTRAELVRYALDSGEFDSELHAKTVRNAGDNSDQLCAAATSSTPIASTRAPRARQRRLAATPRITEVHRLERDQCLA
jgi:DNA-binding NarL/FixJ family response regulator